MTDEQRELLLKAQQSLEAAKLLLVNDFPEYATSRAYYSMFYIAEAFLEGEGLSFSKHSASLLPSDENLPNPSTFHQTSTVS
jgi:uncharacterized protein (UPF0332 family)